MQRRAGRLRVVGWSIVLLMACSGDGGDGDGTGPSAAVASVDVNPPTSSVLAGQPVQLTATVRDAQGRTLSGRTVTWSSEPPALAEVSSAGLVTTRAPGNVTITATVEGRQGTASIESIDPTYIPVFQRPFVLDFDPNASNYHDHDEPKEFVDNNGIYVSWWGEQSRVGIDGHEGYDWQMPTGTPIVAAAAGRVVTTRTTHSPFFCPVLEREVTNTQVVEVEHTLPGGVRVSSAYHHLSSITVNQGQEVAAGEQLGLSGDTGCALQPHLHFAVKRLTQLPPGVTSSLIDPYGWDAPTPDPWTLKPGGAQSINLWKPGQAPTLFRSILMGLPETPSVFVRLTTVRMMGVRDATTPNNEFVAISLDTRVAPPTLNIGGYYITTLAGDTLRIPAGTTLTAARRFILAYTGSGTNTESEIYFGRPSGVYDNIRECIRFFNAANQLRNQASWDTGCTQ